MDTTKGSSQQAALERMSALVDGELDTVAAAQVCSQWRANSPARSAWHAYQLIGDVMRSEDLGADPAHDAAFVKSLSARLASEPVVLAPSALESLSPAQQRLARAADGSHVGARRWWVPTLVAAGFVAVAGALMLPGAPGTLLSPQPGQTLAQVAPAATGAGTDAAITATAFASPAAPANDPPRFVADGQLIRDAGLDRYLAAHKQFAGSSALGVPSGFMRNATADAGAR